MQISSDISKLFEDFFKRNETIVQAEIDSNHQFVREKGCLTDKWFKINNLSVKRWVFTDKVLGVNQLRESVA